MTPIHHTLLASVVFFVGTAVGSFLNVCIYRIPAGMSVFRPRSRCPRCGSGIAIYDNVPILGWIALRGRCRRCAAPISIRYPIVEALVGILFAAIYGAGLALWGMDPTERGLARFALDLVPALFLAALAVLVAFIGLDTRQFPTRLVCWGLTLYLAMAVCLL